LIYLLYSVVVFALFVFLYFQWQHSIVFHPKIVRDNSLFDQNYKFISIEVQNGVFLEGCIYTPTTIKKSFIYFGGRGQDSVGLLPKLAQLYPNCQIAVINYRGYGESDAKASLETVLQDSLKCVEVLQKHYNFQTLFGYSLGSSIATYVASKNSSIKKLILVGAFYSVVDVIYELYHIKLPFFRHNFATYQYIQDLKAEVFICSSQEDSVVPFSSVKKLVARVSKVEFCIQKNLDHVSLLWDERSVKRVKKFLQC